MLDERDPVARAAAAAALGQRPQLSADATAALIDAATDDPDSRVRAAALAALVRAGSGAAAADAWHGAITDDDAAVRRRAADVAPTLVVRAPDTEVISALVALLGDDDITVVEAAAWALGELGTQPRAHGAAAALAGVATGHDDALAREAAVAALGAIGDDRGLAAILAACTDKPAVRRRAVLALAPFDGDDVDAALQRALIDRDWQVRQAAEDLLGIDAPATDHPEDPG